MNTLSKIKVRAIKVIATTGQYLFILPFLPFVGLHLLADAMLMLSAWAIYGEWDERGIFTYGKHRSFFEWLLHREDALDAWRSRSLASLKPSSTSPDAESPSDST